jgi:predicted DNA-binding protein
MSKPKPKRKYKQNRVIASTSVKLPIDYHIRLNALAKNNGTFLSHCATSLLMLAIDDLENGKIEAKFEIKRKL